MQKAFPLPGIEFPLAEEVPTASEEGCHCLKKREATARKIALLSKDSYEVPTSTSSTTTTDTPSGETGKKSGRTVTLTVEDIEKKKNDVKARTTPLLSLPDEHQLRFTEGSETLEQTFNRLQVFIGQLQFIDVEIEHDDLNQKFLTSLAPEWIMHTIVWRNRTDLDTMSLDDLYNHLKGEGSDTPTEPHHTPSLVDQPPSHTTHSSLILPPVTTTSIPTVTPSETTPISQREAFPTDSGFIADQDRVTISKSSTLPHDSAPRVTSPAADEGSMQQTINEFEAQEIEITRLKARVKLLEDRQRVAVEGFGDDAPIKRMCLDEGEAATERTSDDTKEMETVLTSMDTATVLASGAAEVPTGSGSIPTTGPPAAEVPTCSDVVPTASPVFATATVIDAQVARELEEQLKREDQRRSKQIARDTEIARIHDEEELQIMIDGLDQNNETIAKYMQEYHQFASEPPIERRIELISDLVKYQDNYAKESVMKQKTSEEVTEEAKSSDEVPEEKVKEMMQLVPIDEVYVEALQVKHLIIDRKRLVKETLSNRPPTSDKEIELWVELSRLYKPDHEDQLWTYTQNFTHAPVEWKLYDSCRVHHVTSKDKEIFMLVLKDYPLRKGLALVMISYKLQVENYSQMANDLILKIYKIANSPRQQGIEFPLAEEIPTYSEEGYHCLKKREATARKIALLSKSKRNRQSKSNDIFTNDSYEVLISTASTTTTDTPSAKTGKKSGRTVTLTAKDMQKKKNDVKARTTLLLSLPDEHQLRFRFNEFSSNIATALICLATNRTYNFSKMIFDGQVKNVNNKVSKFLMYPRFLTMCLRMSQFGKITHTHMYVVPFHTRKLFTTLRVNSPSFSGRIVLLFDTMLVQQGEGSGTPTEPHHTPSPVAQPPSHTTHSSSTLPPVTTTSIPTVTPSKTTPIRQYTHRARIAQSFAIPTVADEPESPLRDISQGEAWPTNSGFIAGQDRATIAMSSTLPHDSAPRVTSPAADEGNMQQTINELTALCTGLQRQYSKLAGRSIDEGEAAAERTSDDKEEMATVLIFIDTAIFLASGAVEVPTGSGSIPTDGPPAAEVSTDSDVVPIASPVFATATVVTPYRRRKGKEVMVESDTPKKQKVQEQIDAQFASELPIERRIELISDLVKYQDNYAKVHKFQSQQRKPWTKKQKMDYYMAVIRSNLGWKVKDFRGMTFKEVEAKFNSVWKQMEVFILMGSKEEAERIKRKGLSLEQESAKKRKTSEEVTEEAKSFDEVPKEKVKEMMQLVPIEEVYVEALQVKHPIIDWKVHTEVQRSYWKISRLGGSSAIEWKLYDSCEVHHVTSKDKEIFMLVEKDYPLKKGLALVMISYKLQVENYSQMANDLILKIYKIANSPRLQGIEFPLADEVSTASEEGCHYPKKREATAMKIALLSKSRRNFQSKSNDSFTKFLILSFFEITQSDYNIRRSVINSFQQVAAILKTFGGNETTKKTKKNLLKQQYGNFKVEGSETLEQTFNRLQVIIGQLQFMDVEIEQDDLNQKFLTSLPPEWLMHTIVWINKTDLDTMSLDDLYNHLKVYESKVRKKLEPNSQNMAVISLAKHNSENEDGNTACVPTASTNVPTASASVATISQDTACAYIASQSSGKKISIQGSDVAGFDKSKVKCFNCHKMGHLKESAGLPEAKTEEGETTTDKDHALVADEVALTEFALMANISAESKVFDNSLCSKDYKKNNDSLNSKITDLTDKLFDAKNMIYHYKLGLAQVESRLVEYKEREVKYYEKIKTLEFRTKSNNECIEILKKKLETLKQEKKGVDGKLVGLLTALKDLNNLIESQRANKKKEGLGYSVVPPPPAQIYSFPRRICPRLAF
uniref:Uncharacterized protein n=1 Tax=Tanacetum cinerariifolium TaxID=118510 RepID=A0A6L2LTL2_TANCI|nr:hypothetical protein [Tanacetum cinerariifolium]